MTTRSDAKTLTLQYIKTIGLITNQPTGRGFSVPYDVAFSQDERIFVISHAVPSQPHIRIGICTFDEEFLGDFARGRSSNDGQFLAPVAMAFDSQDRLYVTDEEAHRISVFNSAGKFLGKWGSFGGNAGEFNSPAGIAIDADDNVYIVDTQNNRVQKFTTDGKYLTQWGNGGSGPGQFNLPWGAGVDSQGSVYVADWRNDRIQKFAPDGQFLDSFGELGEGDGQFCRPTGVAVDPEGFIYVADWGNERVQVLDSHGNFQLKLRGQGSLSRWATEWLDVNQDEKRARDIANLMPEQLPPHLNTPDHISSQAEPYFWGPVSVKLDGMGRLYVTETCRSRFQIYRKE